MDRYHFRIPVRLMPGHGEPVLEIYDVRHAMEFLMAWPEARQGEAHQQALDACLSAAADAMPAEDTRRIFIRFARLNAILSPDTPPQNGAVETGPRQAPMS